MLLVESDFTLEEGKTYYDTILHGHCPHLRMSNLSAKIFIILFYPTIGRKYFVKTQTIVALFGPHELSLIFLGGMGLEVTSL